MANHNYNEKTSNMSDNMIYFLMGGLVGAGVALLLAPQSGRETRDMLAQRAQEGKNYLVEKGTVLKDQVVQKSQELKDQAADYVDRGLKAVDEGLRSAEGQKDRVGKAVQAGQEAYKHNQAV